MRVLAFDVNETLLDLAALDEPFLKGAGAPDGRSGARGLAARTYDRERAAGPYGVVGQAAGEARSTMVATASASRTAANAPRRGVHVRTKSV